MYTRRIAVSYTHLDVYKRQGINYTMKKTRRTDPALSSALQRLKAQRRELDQTIRELEEMINDPDMDF